VANVIEVGYRSQPSARLSYSMTVFHADYDRLRSGMPGPNAMIENRMQGQTYGVEAWGSWQATKDWRLMAGGTTLREHFTIEPGSREPNGPRDLGNDPPYQTMLRSSLNVTPSQQFDVTLRHIAALGIPYVPAYTALDLRYGWQVQRNLELALIARNLLDHSHPEFGSLPARSEFEPSVMVRATMRW
jgi:iron complex outermembrane receptor protein